MKASCPPCPPIKVDVNQIVKAAREMVLSELDPKPVEADVNTAHVRGLGKMRLVPSAADFSGTDFVLGYATLPPVINFASKLAHEGIILPKIDKTLFRSVATGLNLAAQLATGGSFFLGSLLGQLPTTLDSLADVAIDAIKKGQAAAPAAPAAARGIGQTTAEEIEKLRRDLDRAGVAGHLGQDDEAEMEGSHEDEMDGLGNGEEELEGALSGTMVVE